MVNFAREVLQRELKRALPRALIMLLARPMLVWKMGEIQTPFLQRMRTNMNRCFKYRIKAILMHFRNMLQVIILIMMISYARTLKLFRCMKLPQLQRVTVSLVIQLHLKGHELNTARIYFHWMY